jgi:hypothetical protein
VKKANILMVRRKIKFVIKVTIMMRKINATKQEGRKKRRL